MRSSQFSLFGSSYRLTVTPIDLICVVLLAVGSFGLYAVTAVPGPFDGDSGEFQYMPRLLGLPHPTGYPLVFISPLALARHEAHNTTQDTYHVTGCALLYLA